MSKQPSNPVIQRLEKLEGLWNEFSILPNARILRWVVDEDSLQMIQTLIDLQSESIGTVPDLFVEFKVNFEEPHEYAGQLIDNLKAQYEGSREQMQADGFQTNWVCPACSDPPTIAELINVLSSFHTCCPPASEHLAVVLWPEKSQMPGPWESWLTELAAQKIPPVVRFMVVDRKRFVALERLSRTQPERVVSIDPELDMSAAYEQIVAAAPGNGPGHDFRRYFVALTNAAGAGDVAKAEATAKKAVAIATQEQWPHLAATAWMALGAAYFAAGNLDQTIASYKTANAAIAGVDDDPSKNLEIPARMAEGSALIAAGRFAEAAAVFGNAAVIAAAKNDTTSELECWRIAGWCHETDGKPLPGWDCGEKALDAGARLDEAARSTSTLPYVGQMMVRLADKGTHRSRKSAVQDRMVELLGPEWTAALVAGTN